MFTVMLADKLSCLQFVETAAAVKVLLQLLLRVGKLTISHAIGHMHKLTVNEFNHYILIEVTSLMKHYKVDDSTAHWDTLSSNNDNLYL